MPAPLKLKKCIEVPARWRLFEGYSVEDGSITANVSADKIGPLMRGFIDLHPEHLFFILELPTRLQDEDAPDAGSVGVRHKDVYYIDGLTREQAIAVLFRTGKRLFGDGLCGFGFGGHESREEMFLGKYNVMTVFTADAEKYRPLFDENGIPETDGLVTAWDTFTNVSPGSCWLYDDDGKSVYDIPSELHDLGIYLAERRDDG